MVVITAATQDRYETTFRAMARANMAPVIIEDFVHFGMERGEKIGRAKGLKDGKASGRAEALLRFLEARRLDVSEAERAVVLACGDLETLDHWITRAATCTTAAEVFAVPQRKARRRAASAAR